MIQIQTVISFFAWLLSLRLPPIVAIAGGGGGGDDGAGGDDGGGGDDGAGGDDGGGGDDGDDGDDDDGGGDDGDDGDDDDDKKQRKAFERMRRKSRNRQKENQRLRAENEELKRRLDGDGDGDADAAATAAENKKLKKRLEQRDAQDAIRKLIPDRTSERAIRAAYDDMVDEGIDTTDVDAMEDFIEDWKDDPDNSIFFKAGKRSNSAAETTDPPKARRDADVTNLTDADAVKQWNKMSPVERAKLEQAKPGTSKKMKSLQARTIAKSMREEGLGE